MAVTELSLEVRPATWEDGPAIRHLLAYGARPAVGAWPWEEHLGGETFLAAFSQGRLVGALLAWPDGGPVAWVRLAVLGSGVGVGPWLDRMLPSLVEPLRRLGASTLAWMDVGGWAGPALKARGFRRLTRLVTMLKDTRWLPPMTAEGVCIRPVMEADISSLEPVDHAAFSPPWWLSRTTMERIRQQSACFLVAERGGGLIGYTQAQLTGDGAHIGRLAVIPEAQRQGVGGLLLMNILSRLWEQGVGWVTLNTQEENLASQQLYTRFGFRPVGQRVAVWARALRP